MLLQNERASGKGTGMNLVFVGCEVGPWCKTGVLGGLPPAMAAALEAPRALNFNCCKNFSGPYGMDSSSVSSYSRKNLKKPRRDYVLEQGLALSRASIRSVAIARNVTATFKIDNNVPVGDVYLNPSTFYLSLPPPSEVRRYDSK
ncbi:granule bound starch synthase [Corchorus capsularis]|uniref:Granule bound starch synthase n=1 Tax=Corchorus capsularis TaxID=210143 RepID=A0A1R3IBG8_COCAP|nr:granule bound starch synthase [Corchorus capsularis]